MTNQEIQDQAEIIEATVSQEPANLQEAVQSLASLVAKLAGNLRSTNASVNELTGRFNE